MAVAADQDSHGAGVLVCLDGTMLPALGTTKTHTTALRAFDNVRQIVDRDTADPAARLLGAWPLRPRLSTTSRCRWLPATSERTAGQLEAALADGAAGVVLVATGLRQRDAAALGISATSDRGRRAGWCVHPGLGVGRSEPVYGNGGGHDLLAAGAVLISLASLPLKRGCSWVLALSQCAFRSGTEPCSSRGGRGVDGVTRP